MEEEQEVTTESGKQKLSKSLKAYLCMMNSTYLYNIYLYIFNHIWVIFFCIPKKATEKAKLLLKPRFSLGKIHCIPAVIVVVVVLVELGSSRRIRRWERKNGSMHIIINSKNRPNHLILLDIKRL